LGLSKLKGWPRDFSDHPGTPSDEQTNEDNQAIKRMAEQPIQNKLPDPLPKILPGTVHEQWVRCGRSNCRCADGQLHGPYFYRFWREKGRLRKQYVKPDAVDDVRRSCQNRQQSHEQINAAWGVWQQLLERIREVERR